MKNKKSKELVYLEKALIKAENEKEKIDAEWNEKNRQFNEKYDAKEDEITDIQKKIKELEAKALKDALPKYLKSINKGKDINIKAYKVIELNVDSDGFALKVDEIFNMTNSISHEDRTVYRKNIKFFLGSTIEEAYKMLSSDYVEITEDEYNECRKKVAEAIMKGI